LADGRLCCFTVSYREVDEVSGRSTKFVNVVPSIEPAELGKASNLTNSKWYVTIGHPRLTFGNASKVRVY